MHFLKRMKKNDTERKVRRPILSSWTPSVAHFPAQILYSLYPKTMYRTSFFCTHLQNISNGGNFVIPNVGFVCSVPVMCYVR
jgi:hypothetical protein